MWIVAAAFVCYLAGLWRPVPKDESREDGKPLQYPAQGCEY